MIPSPSSLPPFGAPAHVRSALATSAPDWIAAVGLVTRQRVAAKRSTWNRWNLIAEGERVCAEIRCASPADRNALIDAVATAAERQSVPLNQYRYGVPADAADDLRFAGRTVFDFHGSRLYTDESTLAFEDEVMEARNDDGGPASQSISPSRRSPHTETAKGHPCTTTN